MSLEEVAIYIFANIWWIGTTMLWYLAIFLLKHEAIVFVFGEKMFVENVHVTARFFIRLKSNHKFLWLLVFWMVQVAHVVVVVKCNIERCDVATGVDPVSLSQANPNPMREGKPQDLSAAENWKLHKVYENLDSIAVSVFEDIGWVGQILYQKPRSKWLFWYWDEVPCLFLTNWETLILTLRVSDWQSESDLDSIRNSC